MTSEFPTVDLEDTSKKDTRQLDVYLKNVAGQLIKIEDVVIYDIDNTAFRATYRETTHGKNGKIVTLKKMWFNVSLLLSVTEEWK
jgi:hypothetical protein